MLSVPNNFSYAHEVVLTVKNIRNNKGCIRVAVHDNAKSFRNNTGLDAFKSIKKDIAPEVINTGIMELRFSIEKQGSYAISLFHDETDNGVLDTNIIGIPRGGYGFSNNPGSLLGKPAFKKACFKVGQDVTRLAINLIYR